MFKLVVLSVLIAAAAASPSVISPLGLGWGLERGLVSPWGASLVAPIAPAPVVATSNYRGPLSLAPGQPANILAADGRPLDTLSVNLDRAAHLTAKAIDNSGLRLLKKRSVLTTPVIAPAVAVSQSSRIDSRTGLIAPGLVAPAGLIASTGLINSAALAARAGLVSPAGLVTPAGLVAPAGLIGATGLYSPADLIASKSLAAGVPLSLGLRTPGDLIGLW